MHQRVFVPEARSTKREMLDNGSRGLTMDWISIGKGIFETRDNGVNVVFALLCRR
jgi:hypothetical protein